MNVGRHNADYLNPAEILKVRTKLPASRQQPEVLVQWDINLAQKQSYNLNIPDFSHGWASARGW